MVFVYQYFGTAQIHNPGANINPTVNDDSADGYAVGSRWVNTTSDEEFVCTDATVGAAVWVSTTAGSTGTMTGAAIKAAYEAEPDTNAFTDAHVTKLAGIETNADVTSAVNVAAVGAVMESDTTTAAMSFAINEPSMTSNSATKLPVQSSVKSYVDTSISAALASAMVYKGEYNAATNTPDLDVSPTGVLTGHTYIVTTAGTFFTASVAVGDTLIAAADAADALNEWTIVPSTLSAAEIKTQYESNADTNAFTDAEQGKLAGIETLADVTDATNVDAAGAVMNSDYNANTVLAATTDNTPAPITIGDLQLLGRSGTIGGISLGTNLSLSGSTLNAAGGSSTGLTSVATLAALKALAKSGLATGDVRMNRAYSTEGDGGGGIWRYDSTSSATANEGTIVATNEGGTGRWFRTDVTAGPVNVLWFGARKDGSADARAAIQAAIDYCQANQMADLYIPSGRYSIVGVASPDSKLNGLLVTTSDPVAASSSGYWKALRISGAGRSTSLVAASDNMIIIRCAGCNNLIENMSLIGGSRPNVWGIMLGPESLTQTTTRVDNSYNVVRGMFIKQCTEGVVQTPGPTVGANSGCYYNGYHDLHIYGCTRGIWLRLGVHTDNSPNRGAFHNIRIGGGGTCNTGIQIDAGDTNQFISVHCEGVTSATGPNSPAVGVRIMEYGGGSWNGNNTFVACMMEANTTNILNSNTGTKFSVCNGIP